MSETKKLLVFTDLDGTLLDHHTYSFDPAKPMLQALKSKHFPVIPTTSKTHAELIELRQQLNSEDPFIVENGAAVFIPKGYFATQPEDCVERGEFWIKAFGLERAAWQSLLNEVPDSLKSAFKSFQALGDEGVASCTGLDIASAQRANTRDFSEPLLWQGTDHQLEALTDYLASHQVGLVAGGRFLHLHNGYNKGIALKWLNAVFQAHMDTDTQTVALGDGDNDREMLQAADTAVVIINPPREALVLDGHPNQLTSTLPGPNGWAECLQQVVETL